MKNFIKLYKSKLCSLLWTLLAFEALVVVYLLAPSPVDPLIVIEPNFASLSGDNIIYEEGNSARYTVSVSTNVDKELHVTLSYGGGAVRGVDYNAPSSVVIKKGDMNTTFELVTLDDNELEGEELISVKIVKIDGKKFMQPLRPQDLGGVVFTKIFDESKHARKSHSPAVITLTCDKTLQENNATANCTLQSSQKSFEPLIVSLAYSGKATFGSDYSADQEITLPAGKKRVQFTVNSIDDAYKEGSEQIVVSIVSLKGGGFEETRIDQNVATINLLDEKTTTQVTQLSIDAVDTIEEGGSAVYSLTLSRVPLSDVIVHLQRNKSATKFKVPQKVVFAKGETSKQFSVVSVDDNIKEKRDFISFSIEKVDQQSFERLSYSNKALKTKVVDEKIPEKPDEETAYLTLTAPFDTIAESAGQVEISINSSQVVYQDTPVYLAIKSDKSQGRSFNISKKVLLKKGEQSATVKLHLKDNNVQQRDETLTLEITKHGDAGLEDLRVKAPLHLTLTDGEAGSTEDTLSIICPKVLRENSKTLSCRLTLSNITQSDIKIALAYSGEASYDEDYKAPKEVSIAKGKKSISFKVKSIDDIINEGEETLVVGIASVKQNYFEKLILKKSTQIIVLKDEKKPTKTVFVTVKVNKEVKEGDSTPATFSLSEVALKDVTLELSMPNSDDFRAVEKVVIAKGTKETTVNIESINDNFKERNEYVVLKIKGVLQEGFEKVTFDKRTHRVLIVDDAGSKDAATLSISAKRSDIFEDEKRIALTLTLSQPTQKPMKIVLTQAGEAKKGVDYTMLGSAIIAKGKQRTTLTLKPINDNIIEDPESIVVSVQSHKDGGLETITLSDPLTLELHDDQDKNNSPQARLTLKGPSKVSEGEKSKTYTVTLSQKAQKPMKILLSYGGDAGATDYKQVASTFIEKDNKKGRFTLETIDNQTIDKLRTFTVAIEKIEGGGLENVAISTKVLITAITDEKDIAAAFQEIVNDEVIKFDIGSTEINDDAKLPLHKIAALIKQFPSAKLTVEGHTNHIGSIASNLKLSQNRANSIKAYIVSQGVPAKRIKAVGFGSSQPLLNDGSKEALEFNKRVEFKVVY